MPGQRVKPIADRLAIPLIWQGQRTLVRELLTVPALF